MRARIQHLLAITLAVCALALFAPVKAMACPFDGGCSSVNLDAGAATIELSGEQAARVVGVASAEIPMFVYRLRQQCVVAAELTGNCSPASIRTCPQQPGRVIDYFFVQRRPVVQPGEADVLDGFGVGDPIGDWENLREGCFDITDLNPPPSPGEVFAYFQRLPLPRLETRHQPPGNGLSGLPVIFYTDSPATQTFTVDIRGFTVVIAARAEQYTWHTGDGPPLVTTDPGRPYPDQTVEHEYESGTHTASLTVTWGATFTVDGSAPADVPGTTTTDGPPITFDVLEARPVLTDPYD